MANMIIQFLKQEQRERIFRDESCFNCLSIL